VGTSRAKDLACARDPNLGLSEVQVLLAALNAQELELRLVPRLKVTPCLLLQVWLAVVIESP
jgi:hypothetical protein